MSGGMETAPSAPAGPGPSPRPRMITPTSTPTKEKPGDDKDGDKDKMFPKSPKKLSLGKEGKIGPGTKRRTCDENFVPVARALPLCASVPGSAYDASIATWESQPVEVPGRKRSSTEQGFAPTRRIATCSIHLPDAGPDSPWARTQLVSFSASVYQFCSAGPAAFLSDELSISSFEPEDKLHVAILPQLRPFLIFAHKGDEDACGVKALTEYLVETKQMAVVDMRTVETTACLSDSAPTFKRCRRERLLMVRPDAAQSDVDSACKVHVNPHLIGMWIAS